MAVKLHRCRLTWLKIGPHPCWKVQKTLDEEGVDYELIPGPLRDRSALQKISGQGKYPAIEFEDGRVYREESKDMVARIHAGTLADAPTVSLDT